MNRIVGRLKEDLPDVKLFKEHSHYLGIFLRCVLTELQAFKVVPIERKTSWKKGKYSPFVSLAPGWKFFNLGFETIKNHVSRRNLGRGTRIFHQFPPPNPRFSRINEKQGF
ncbi:TPA: hypothetical protein ACHU46_002180, partial [Streptococcus suis]